VVQGGTRNSTRRYKEVQGGTRIDQLVRAGTCWYVLMVQTGYAFVLDSLLQFCPAESAVLETSLSNHTYASSSMFQSTWGPPALGGPLNVLFGAGRRWRWFFQRRRQGRARGFLRRDRRWCNRAGSMKAAGGSSTLLATTASPEGAASDTGAALATNLQIKGLATGRRISCGSSRRNR
jgi:hypothetical protein